MQGRLNSVLTIDSPAPSARILRTGTGSVSKTIATPKGYAGTISSGSVTASWRDMRSRLNLVMRGDRSMSWYR